MNYRMRSLRQASKIFKVPRRVMSKKSPRILLGGCHLYNHIRPMHHFANSFRIRNVPLNSVSFLGDGSHVLQRTHLESFTRQESDHPPAYFAAAPENNGIAPAPVERSCSRQKNKSYYFRYSLKISDLES